MESAAGLGRLQVLEEFAGTAAPARPGRRAAGNVVMVAAATGQPHGATLWVRAGYGSYRAAYSAFLKAAYGITTPPVDLAAYDIDHLLNRTRSGQDSAFLRIEVLPLSANRQWGSFLEKLASAARVHGNTRTRRLMSYLIAGKVAGLQPPAALDDLVGRRRLARGIAALGLPPKEVEDGLANMSDHIQRNLP